MSDTYPSVSMFDTTDSDVEHCKGREEKRREKKREEEKGHSLTQWSQP